VTHHCHQLTRLDLQVKTRREEGGRRREGGGRREEEGVRMEGRGREWRLKR